MKILIIGTPSGRTSTLISALSKALEADVVWGKVDFGVEPLAIIDECDFAMPKSTGTTVFHKHNHPNDNWRGRSKQFRKIK